MKIKLVFLPSSHLDPNVLKYIGKGITPTQARNILKKAIN
jgi:hypothetical protein